MSIKVKDIVVNLVGSSESEYTVGQYVEKYDVRIIPEMITKAKYAEVMYIDTDGAIITKEFGPYAYPADALRLANEKEKELYEIEKYTVVVSYKDADYTFPMPVAKLLVDEAILLGNKNVDANDQVFNFVRDYWDTVLRGQEEAKSVLLAECYSVLKRRILAGRGCCYTLEYLIDNILGGKNNDIIADFIQAFYVNPVAEKDVYRMIENRGYEIPKVYAEGIKEVSGYVSGSLIEGIDLYDYLKENRRYDSSFRHYSKLSVSDKGIALLFNLELGQSDTRRYIEKLNLNLEQLKRVLMNPKRDFYVDMSIWFSRLDWKEIMDNEDMFSNCLTSISEIKKRLSAGKYVAPEIASRTLVSTGTFYDMTIGFLKVKNKSELKLKELVAFLGSLSEDITVDDIMEQNVNGDGTKKENINPLFSPKKVSFDAVETLVSVPF